MMAASNVNALRTYTPPPRWLLEEAQRHGLRVMVGLAAERYVGYLNDGYRHGEIARMACGRLGECWGHPAILCYAVANEVPAAMARWFGRRRMEHLIARLCDEVREADPDATVTYVSYPSTEYLQLPFVDLLAFNEYNAAGHIRWGGRVYGNGLTRGLVGARRWHVYYGTQGSGLFQSLYQRSPRGLERLPLMPEWYLLLAGLSVLSVVGTAWRPLLLVSAALLAVTAAPVLVQAVLSATAAEFPARRRRWVRCLRCGR